jgi:hypothetical protein
MHVWAELRRQGAEVSVMAVHGVAGVASVAGAMDDVASTILVAGVASDNTDGGAGQNDRVLGAERRIVYRDTNGSVQYTVRRSCA